MHAAAGIDLLMLGGQTMDEGLLRYAHVCVPAAELTDITARVTCNADTLYELLELTL